MTRALHLMAGTIKEMQQTNRNAQQATALQQLFTMDGRESYMRIKSYFKIIDDYTVGWSDREKCDLIKKRTSHRALKVFEDAKYKYGRKYDKIRKRMIDKLALTDTHKFNYRLALSNGLHRKPEETLKQFGSRVYEVVNGAPPRSPDLEELAVQNFLSFLGNPVLATQLGTGYSHKKVSFEEVLMKAVEAENLLKGYERRRSVQKNFPSDRVSHDNRKNHSPPRYPNTHSNYHQRSDQQSNVQFLRKLEIMIHILVLILISNLSSKMRIPIRI